MILFEFPVQVTDLLSYSVIRVSLLSRIVLRIRYFIVSIFNCYMLEVQTRFYRCCSRLYILSSSPDSLQHDFSMWLRITGVRCTLNVWYRYIRYTHTHTHTCDLSCKIERWPQATSPEITQNSISWKSFISISIGYLSLWIPPKI